MGIVEFLEARIAEDEADARAANEGRLLAWSKNDHMVIVDSGFMQTFTPSRVLREVAAKRRLVELYGSLSAQWAPNVDYGFAQTTLRTLAAIYSDHPDYNEEWRP